MICLIATTCFNIAVWAGYSDLSGLGITEHQTNVVLWAAILHGIRKHLATSGMLKRDLWKLKLMH